MQPIPNETPVSEASSTYSAPAASTWSAPQMTVVPVEIAELKMAAFDWGS